MNYEYFGLKSKKSGKILSINIVNFLNNQEKPISVYELSENGNEEWLVKDIKTAQETKNTKIKWHQTSYERPLHHFEKDELEIIKVKYKWEVEEIEEEGEKIENRVENNERQFKEKDMKEEVEQEKSFKVICLMDVIEDIGSIRLRTEPKRICFEKGKEYTAFEKDEKLYIINKDEIPEMIINKYTEESWNKDNFLKRHFKKE